MNIIDLLSLIIVGLFAITACNKGPLMEFMSLVAIVGGYFLAHFTIPLLLNNIPIAFPLSAIIELIWITVNIFWLTSICVRPNQRTIDTYHRTGSDWLTGICLGSIKGYVLMLTVMSVVFSMTVKAELLATSTTEDEAKMVPKFLYSAKSYEFWKNSYLAVRPAFQQMLVSTNNNGAIPTNVPLNATDIPTSLPPEERQIPSEPIMAQELPKNSAPEAETHMAKHTESLITNDDDSRMANAKQKTQLFFNTTIEDAAAGSQTEGSPKSLLTITSGFSDDPSQVSEDEFLNEPINTPSKVANSIDDIINRELN